MKNKDLIIFSLLILIIVVVGYVVFNKQEKNLVVETTTTTKLALCSNEYYKTKYDIDGKIIIDGWSTCVSTNPSDEEIEAGTATSHGPYCESNKVSHIKDLVCVQKLDLSGILDANSFITFLDEEEKIDPENNPRDIANLVNLEDLNLSLAGVNAKDTEFILSQLTKLKVLNLSYATGPNNINIFSKLIHLENLRYNEPGATLEKDDLLSQELCQIVKITPSLKLLNGVKIDSKALTCDKFLEEMASQY